MRQLGASRPSMLQDPRPAGTWPEWVISDVRDGFWAADTGFCLLTIRGGGGIPNPCAANSQPALAGRSTIRDRVGAWGVARVSTIRDQVDRVDSLDRPKVADRDP